ncbi:MAG: DUF4124 domain-containing protein [Halioglobus sp.]
MNRAMPTCVLVLITALSLYSSMVSAGQNVYRWMDDRGNPVNSDRPPPAGTDYEVISTQSSMVRSVDGEEGAVPAKVKPSVGNEFEPVDTSKPKIEKNPEFCARAKENLATLDTHARIRLRDDQGEVRYLTEEEKQLERNKALDTIKHNCD